MRLFFFLLSISLAFSSVVSLGGPVRVDAVSGGAECSVCVDFMGQAINTLLNAILNGGLVPGCSALCALTGPLVLPCEALCLYVGYEEFVKVINMTDPDPIYICQELDACNHPAPGHFGNVTVDGLTVTPTSGSTGTDFTITFKFTVNEATSVGQVLVAVVPPDAEPFGAEQLTDGLAVGSYSVPFKFKATASEQEPFDAGTYGVEAAVCDGTCTSPPRHKYQKILATAQS
eukprot:CAMPEP_0170748646 /NCGR_PEP_ID=MMETSP0437-20130122/9977_1 /TAXON_ID=0 /ORGANISM="Sexangularia sp." /LENGTH=230 /DNA_ID=CAMNT_0011087525 /DNA_START=23 /DNA_END=712 /DNA_ORIENTATION=+